MLPPGLDKNSSGYILPLDSPILHLFGVGARTLRSSNYQRENVELLLLLCILALVCTGRPSKHLREKAEREAPRSVVPHGTTLSTCPRRLQPLQTNGRLRRAALWPQTRQSEASRRAEEKDEY